MFIAAALEANDELGSLGLVVYWMVDSNVIKRYFFADIAPPRVMNLFQKDTKKVIAGLELLAGVVAFFLLGKLRNMCRTFLPVDNEAARASLISMNSSVSSHRMLLRCLSQFLAKHSACIHLDCQSTIQF